MQIRNLLLGATLVTPALLSAQEFYRPEPEVYKNELTIGVSVTNSVDISFKSNGYAASLSTALFQANADGDTALYGVVAPTGNVYADSEYYSTVTTDDNDTPDDTSDDTTSTVYDGISEDENGDAWTGYFTLYSADQLGYFDGDGNFVSDNLTKADETYYVYQSYYYSEASDPVVYEQSDDYNPGIDVNYTRYFDNKGRFAVIVGFTSHGAQSSGSESQTAIITENRTYYEADFDNALTIDSDDNPYGSYTGVYTRVDEDDEDGRNLINMRDTISKTVTGTGTVTSDWDVDVGYYDFRLGAQFQFNISRKWSVKLAGGASATYVDSTFRLLSQLYPDGIDEDSDFDFDNGQSVYREDSESEIIYGGWGSADIVYNINRRVSWSFGAKFQSGDTYEHSVTGTFRSETVEIGRFSLDIGNAMSVKSAVSFKF
jgi:hypothetical protein